LRELARVCVLVLISRSRTEISRRRSSGHQTAPSVMAFCRSWRRWQLSSQ
jgi:hypothetical protein